MSKRGTITDSNIDKVVHESLRVLDLSESDISDQGLSSLRRCPKLQKIDLNSAKKSRTMVTSQGIISMSQSCHNLQTVYLRRCLNITDEAVISLSENCPQLRLLNVGGCTLLTDRSLQFLAQNSKFLKCLNMSNTKVTDNGVIALTSGQCAQTLKEIHINGCVALTDEAVEAVLQFCPLIEILLFHACPKITENSRQALEDLTIQRKSPMKQVTWTIY
ncbi:hypothetical protein FSP39_021833 [Pinctada imbricata]|uniref:F-box/LRR-repeat protein 15-like leucin rich repeat domain-containing protein n=1 Tax=Pinctada imbricata TaxID=66713 RepID=A0AA88YG79_PINIB|nr:hypothetical protein FSP39_021833 [Pinctada imbricata]